MERMRWSARVLILTTCCVLSAGTVRGQTDCAKLHNKALSDGKILSAARVAPGEFAPPAGTRRSPEEETFAKKLPAFCRVVAVATPSADSSISIEVWMPESGWNGRFRGQGNGGFAGEIGYGLLEFSVLSGYASAATDTGHSGRATDASWALGHPEKVADFGYRGIHEMTRVAKAVLAAYYGKQPEHSFFASCSNGGRQALMEAQRYPEDYDGILAGAPANSWTHLLTNALGNAQALAAESGSYIPPGKLPAIAHAVNAACDAEDGVLDGVLNDPRQCHFEPASLQCKDSETSECLTAPQVITLKKLYAGAHGAHGELIFPGYLPGAEDGQGAWLPWITGTAMGRSLMFAFGGGFFTNMVYENADWDFKSVTLDQALKTADEKTARNLNAVDPDLSKFSGRGGKLIVYHGWNDPAISALNSINYYESVVKKMGQPKAEAFARLYMVPGMLHCGDGPGANSFGEGPGGPPDPQRNITLALEQWVEKGAAPGALTATKYVNDEEHEGVKMTRPLCPYPQVAKYKGVGDSNDRKNFVCAAASK
jgi:tannase/feruloyl esterase